MEAILGNLLFSPSGRINSSEFRKGAVILLALNFFLWLTWYAGVAVGALAALLSFGFIYCWICLFAKRFEDAGKSPAWFIAVFFGFLFLSYILAGFLALVLSPDLLERNAELQAAMQNDPEDIQALMPLMNQMMQSLIVPYAVAYFFAGAIIAFGTNALLKSK